MDQKGYVMNGLAFLLILPAILLVAVYIDMTTLGGQSVSLVMQSDTTFYAAKDIERNIPVIGSGVIEEVALNATTTGTKLPDSRSHIKNQIQQRMNSITQNMKTSIGADDISCNITSVGASTNPFLLEINSTIYVKKGTSVHKDTISQDIDLGGLPDPLPFIKIKEASISTLPTLDSSTGKISYGTSLSQYLQKRGVANYTVYENATSQGYLDRCSFEPYESTIDGHGVNATPPIQNLGYCLSNGYYHESSDGACYLCRLEGNAVCSHYGLETFIVPPASNNATLIFAPVSIDHVIFSDSPYSGKALIYLESGNNPTTYYKLFLDEGHRKKYGLPL